MFSTVPPDRRLLWSVALVGALGSILYLLSALAERRYLAAFSSGFALLFTFIFPSTTADRGSKISRLAFSAACLLMLLAGFASLAA